MAYSTYYSDNFTTGLLFFDRICTGLTTNFGWTIHDTISATNKVYKSQGSSNVYTETYLRVYYTSDSLGDFVTFEVYLFWNNTTHVGTCRTNPVDANIIAWNTTATKGPLWMYGNDNMVAVYSGIQDSNFYNKFVVFGFLANLYDSIETNLSDTSGASAGSNVSIEVDSSSDFIVNRQYIIIGDASVGREPVLVNEIIDSTHIRVATLVGNYPVDSVIGEYPCPFGITLDNERLKLYGVSNYGLSGTSDGGSTDYLVSSDPFLVTSIDPSATRNRYLMYNPLWYDPRDSYEHQVGYSSTDFVQCPKDHGTVAGYNTPFYYLGRQEDGAASEVSGSSTLKDSTKSWVVNEFADKVVFLLDGNGLGQSRVIASNTSDTLTLTTAWFIKPQSGSLFKICDEVYRICGRWAMKEVI